MRLRRTPYKVALTVHILASVGWFGAAVAVAFCAFAAGTTSDATLATALFRAIQTSLWLTIPLGLLSFATGAVLALGTTWGLVKHWWVVAKLGINLAVIATDVVVVRLVVHDALAHRSGRPPYDSTMAHCIVLAIATVLSVFKPKARTPFAKSIPALRRRDGVTSKVAEADLYG